MAIIIVLGILILINATSTHIRGHLRVYKGETDLHNEFPFAVTLQISRQPYFRFCTGSIIAEHWVLSAAHCVSAFTPTQIVIRYGDFTKAANETKLYSRVIKIYVHPNYNPHAMCNDIALIFVEKMRNKKHARLLALDYNTLFGLPVKYAGFGITSKHNKINITDKIRADTAPLQVGEGVVSSCEKYSSVIFKDVLCIAPKCSKRMQQARGGDSGGPLVYDGRVIGVARSIAVKIPISQFTPISPFLEWLKNTMLL